MSRSLCPSAADLRMLVLGTLPPDEFEFVVEHLDDCRACEETVSALEATLSLVVPTINRGAVTAGSTEERSAERALSEVADIVQQTLGTDGTSSIPRGQGELSTGTRLGNYRIRELIGRGGMGHVYLATQTFLERDVALKVLPAAPTVDRDRIARFEREMKIAAKLAHENIVAVFDAGVDNGLHYLSMPLLRGLDLATIAERRSPMPVPDACEVIRQAALGLQHAHDAGVIHRDVKPSNLMLAEDEHGILRVKVLDLGLARLVTAFPPGELTSPGQIMGTLDYLAPEQALHPDDVDHRTDIYGLGASLYRLLSGRIPLHTHRGQPAAKRLHELVNSAPPSLAELRPDIPEPLAALVHQMLAITPAHRPQSMDRVVEQLIDFCPETHNLRSLLAPNKNSRGDTHSPSGHRPSGIGCKPGGKPAAMLHDAADCEKRSPGRLARPIAATVLVISLAMMTLFVRTPQGTIEVTSELENVVVRIIHDDDPAAHEEWTIRRGTNTHQVRVGEIAIELPAELNDLFLVEQDQSTLARNGRIAATIRKRTPPRAGENSAMPAGIATTKRDEQSIPATTETAAATLTRLTHSDDAGTATSPDGFPVHPALAEILGSQPIAVQEFDDDHVIERSSEWVREFRDGRLIIDTAPRNRLDAWPVMDLTGSGLIEIDVRIVHGRGWLVVFHNDALNRGFHLSFHKGYLALGPSIFNVPQPGAEPDTTDAISSPKLRTLMEHAPSRGAGNLDRVHVLIEGRRVSVFLNGRQSGDPVELDFEPGQHRLCAGLMNTQSDGTTRIEFERIRKYPLQAAMSGTSTQ